MLSRRAYLILATAVSVNTAPTVYTTEITTATTIVCPTSTIGLVPIGSYTRLIQLHSAFDQSLRYPIGFPVTFATPFAPAYTVAKSLLPSNITYTTWSLDPAATAIPDGKYGQSAYAAQWEGYSYNNTVPFTTTASATPVPSTELIYPPALYTPCPGSAESCIDCHKLEKDFIWGMSGSAWQIEGGTQSEGRGPSSLDQLGNLLGPVPTTDDAVVSDMNYFLYKQDIARLAALGVPYYSFSIQWSRIVPFGKKDTPVNIQALDHYDDVINTCLEHGIKPIITMVHFDPPIAVSLDNSSSVEDFVYYAQQLLTRYSDRVPYWVTFNELNLGIPHTFQTYNGFTNVLLGHSTVYKWYKDVLKGTGQFTIKFANNLAVPLTTDVEDVKATTRYQHLVLGILGNPLFLGQQYPQEALDTPNLNLTALTAEQISFIHGSIDFWSLDPYVAQFGSAPEGGIDACISNSSDPLWPFCIKLGNVQENGWLMGQRSRDYAYIAH
ncbi:beta-glucosidase [Aureobasidium subglaciale]|nr:beta-glucosidase [Aureobasidium subglaciale]KAI5215121.1 beta-glucosidase [Aureobasidium subglaciale]KAI5218303.1 beta-glucosidase [Aureobasidium subglaciale]KAI5256033.1 beta-glucosidase [Aureobasidium subglaciale]